MAGKSIVSVFGVPLFTTDTVEDVPDVLDAAPTGTEKGHHLTILDSLESVFFEKALDLFTAYAKREIIGPIIPARIRSIMSSKPIIAVTMGDPAGIGPEIDSQGARRSDHQESLAAVDLGRLGRAATRLAVAKKIYPKLICWQPGQPLLPMLNHPRAHVVCSLSTLSARESRPGVSSKAGGHGAFSYIRVAAKLALSKVADAIATAPISKSILIDAGYNYPGHTELLAELSRTAECRMMLIGAKLRVVPVTGHIPFTKVARSLTRENIQTTLELTHRSLKDFFGIAQPAHRGGGAQSARWRRRHFRRRGNRSYRAGGESSARKNGIPAFGPFPADSLFHHAARGDYDAVVCMYHDQGLIPLKLHHFFGGVALTLGPPFHPNLGGSRHGVRYRRHRQGRRHQHEGSDSFGGALGAPEHGAEAEMNPSIFREYDIRGLAEKDFDKDFALLLGKVHGTAVAERGGTRVTVGRDCRTTSDAYAEAVIAGMVSRRTARLRHRHLSERRCSIFLYSISTSTAAFKSPRATIRPNTTALRSVSARTRSTASRSKKFAPRWSGTSIGETPGGKVERYEIVPPYHKRLLDDVPKLARPLKVVVDAGQRRRRAGGAADFSTARLSGLGDRLRAGR